MDKIEHLLVCLIEECAEIQKAATKALRFGLDDGYPEGITTNAQDISKEWCHAIAVMELLEEEGVIKNKYGGSLVIEEKKAKVQKYMEYAKERGTLIAKLALEVSE